MFANVPPASNQEKEGMVQNKRTDDSKIRTNNIRTVFGRTILATKRQPPNNRPFVLPRRDDSRTRTPAQTRVTFRHLQKGELARKGGMMKRGIDAERGKGRVAGNAVVLDPHCSIRLAIVMVHGMFWVLLSLRDVPF